MVSVRRTEHFSFFDLPRTLWFFLGEERWNFLFFSGVLLTVLCYGMVPPYIVPATLFRLDGAGSRLLSGSYAIIALIRL